VHAGEYVFDSETTRELGVPFLRELHHRGADLVREFKMPMPGYAAGGLVAKEMGGRIAAAANEGGTSTAGGDTININVPVTVNAPSGTIPRETRLQLSQEVATRVQHAMARR
jgi:hypothetical protein